MKKVLFNWSGGKDSSLCLNKMLGGDHYDVYGLLTSINREISRVSMHGIREELIQIQAQNIGIPLHFLHLPEQVNMEEYNRLMVDTLRPFKDKGINYCAFGDIFLEDLRTYREEKLKEIEMQALFPLWKNSTKSLAREFIDLGFRAIISSVDGSKLDASFVGREYNSQFLEDLPKEVDPCGENGEFHSFVYNGPIFENPVSVKKGKVVKKTYELTKDSNHSYSVNSSQPSSYTYWFIDLLPDL